MAWHGIWHGMAWHMAWHGMAYGMAWHGMAWHGKARHGMWHGMACLARHGRARQGMAWQGRACNICGKAGQGMGRCAFSTMMSVPTPVKSDMWRSARCWRLSPRLCARHGCHHSQPESELGMRTGLPAGAAGAGGRGPGVGTAVDDPRSRGERDRETARAVWAAAAAAGSVHSSPDVSSSCHLVSSRRGGFSEREGSSSSELSDNEHKLSAISCQVRRRPTPEPCGRLQPRHLMPLPNP